ncbi:MAG: hypothetical protein M0Q87_15100, partial [Ottowia sp.]|nr:hypothetical protein [Ottowia sp.]
AGMARAMASICNAEWAGLGGQSGHEGFFLKLSDAASYITGDIITCDGGSQDMAGAMIRSAVEQGLAARAG